MYYLEVYQVPTKRQMQNLFPYLIFLNKLKVIHIGPDLELI